MLKGLIPANLSLSFFVVFGNSSFTYPCFYGGWSKDKYDIDAIFTHSMLYNVKMSSACNSHYTAIKSKVIGWGLA